MMNRIHENYDILYKVRLVVVKDMTSKLKKVTVPAVTWK